EAAYDTVTGAFDTGNGFRDWTPYVLGDLVAERIGARPVGVPHMGGYAVGRVIVERYLAATGLRAAQAIVRPVGEILAGAGVPARRSGWRALAVGRQIKPDRVGDDRDGEEARHDHRAEVLVIVEIAAPVESREEDCDRADARADDDSPGPRSDRPGEQSEAGDYHEKAKRGVEDQQEVPVEERPGDALGDTAEVLGRAGARMISGHGDEEVHGHPEEELDDEHA